MIEFLHIPGNEYFEDCTLNNLAKINVLCGKNNSGKTTTLNNIFDEPKKAHLGKRISWEEVKGVFGIGNGSSANPFNSQFLIDSLKGIFKEKEVWFENEEDKLHDFIRPYFQTWAVQNSYGGNFSLPNLHPIFNTSFKKILIPPRRSIQHTVKLDAKEKVSASGSGIINNIFYCKNRTDKKSDEWKAYEELNRAFTIVSGGYEFLLELTSSNNINLQYSLNGASAIGAEVSGIGLHNILILLYFSIFPNYDIILIEEPETHLHAATQKRLLTYWQVETDKQFFLTTHSNVFLDNSYVDRIFLTQYKNATITVTENSNRAEILHDLGYSVADNLISDLTVLCEGPYDVPVIEELLRKMGVLDKYNVKCHFMGGDTMGMIDLTLFTTHNPVLAVIDKDPGSKSSRNKFIQNCDKHNIQVHQLKRYAIENYFTPRALKEVFKAQISDDFTEILPDRPLVDQIRINVKSNNRKIAKELRLEEVEGTDLKEFLDLVAETCKNTQAELNKN